MPFKNPEMRVPDVLRTVAFLLRPIQATDASLDYEAVMESRSYLRAWEQTDWPRDDFTENENREDLAKLEKRHAAGETFTYTVMTPDETRCLGCLYIVPVDSTLFTRSRVLSVNGNRWPDRSAAVYFWVRKSELAGAMDRRLLDGVGPWLNNQWGLCDHVFVTNEQFQQQVRMMEAAGLELEFRIDDPKAEGMFLAYSAKTAHL